MIDRSRAIRPVGHDPEKWAKRWGIEPCTHPCQVCGAPRTTDRPFAKGEIRGLESSRCAHCGDDSGVPYCVVSTDGAFPIQPERRL